MRERDDVTPEIISIVWEIVEGWYPDQIDWEDVWDRLDGAELEDGSRVDVGDTLDSPAQVAIKRRIRAMRREAL